MTLEDICFHMVRKGMEEYEKEEIILTFSEWYKKHIEILKFENVKNADHFEALLGSAWYHGRIQLLKEIKKGRI